MVTIYSHTINRTHLQLIYRPVYYKRDGISLSLSVVYIRSRKLPTTSNTNYRKQTKKTNKQNEGSTCYPTHCYVLGF